MSDTAQAILIFLLLPSPLYIPIAVTVVAAITNWRNALRERTRATVTNSPSAAAAQPAYRLRAALPAK
jgi:hypothetical protein